MAIIATVRLTTVPHQRATLNVSLTPELNEFIASLVQSGQYKSASEVVREGLRLLQQRKPTQSGPNKRQMNEMGDKGAAGEQAEN